MAGKLARLLHQGWYVAAATVLMTTQPFITTMTRNDSGGYDYLAVRTRAHLGACRR